jgi:hypothetical protein
MRARESAHKVRRVADAESMKRIAIRYCTY